jgi:ActR/RegA family two-component response regulator
LPAAFGLAIAEEATRIGWTSLPASSVDDVARVFSPAPPELAIVNVDAPGGLEVVARCRDLADSRCNIAAITDTPSLVRASEVIRGGASVILARPTTLAQVVAILEGRLRDDHEPMSLDRAIWEFLHQSVVESGSISAAARRLRLDRTSLKRMLRKAPPLT